MSWAEIRKKARETVHSTFALPAVFSALDGSVIAMPINVRLHNKRIDFGDLDREGFARVIENENKIIFDSQELYPVEGVLTFTFTDEEDLVYNVINVLPPGDGGRFIPTDVVRKPT